MMMLKKEFRELFTSYKMLFVPIIFTILMITQPITLKMLPDLLSKSANLPEGSTFYIPEPSAGEALASALSKFDSLGVFILIMIVMGTIAGERASGVTAMIMVKPISRMSYYVSKICAYACLTLFSLVVAVLASVYYVDIQFGHLDWVNVLKGTLLYYPNLLLIVVSTICASAFFTRSVTAGGVSLVINLILFTVPSFYEDTLGKFAPKGVTSAAEEMIHRGTYSDQALTSFLGVSVLIGFFFLIGWFLFRKQEL
ncbi:ABC transporter permease [Bacillus sp. DWP3-1]|uniref:ABC transporter permease n=1 Tax=unclassified Bacillus (in: firmicutes) TaxID=185979 RepID=UPI003CF9ECF5